MRRPGAELLLEHWARYARTGREFWSGPDRLGNRDGRGWPRELAGTGGVGAAWAPPPVLAEGQRQADDSAVKEPLYEAAQVATAVTAPPSREAPALKVEAPTLTLPVPPVSSERSTT